MAEATTPSTSATWNSDQCHHERALASVRYFANSRMKASSRRSTISNQPRVSWLRAAATLAQPRKSASRGSAGRRRVAMYTRSVARARNLKLGESLVEEADHHLVAPAGRHAAHHDGDEPRAAALHRGDDVVARLVDVACLDSVRTRIIRDEEVVRVEGTALPRPGGSAEIGIVLRHIVDQMPGQ